MNTLTETPAGHASDYSIHLSPAAVAAVSEIKSIVAPNLRKWTWPRVKDILVACYAYGLLAFGLGFPLLLAAWTAFYGGAAR